MHPLYSPDFAPDYYLFRSLQNSLNGINLTSKKACEITCFGFLPRNLRSLWNNGSTQKNGRKSSIKTYICL